MVTMNIFRLEVLGTGTVRSKCMTARRRLCGVTGLSTWWPVGTRGTSVTDLFKIVFAINYHVTVT